MRDSIISTRINRTTLATIATHFLNEGIIVDSRAAFLRKALEHMAAILVENNLATPITEVKVASEILENFFDTGELNHGGRALRGLYESMTISSPQPKIVHEVDVKKIEENTAALEEFKKRKAAEDKAKQEFMGVTPEVKED